MAFHVVSITKAHRRLIMKALTKTGLELAIRCSRKFSVRNLTGVDASSSLFAL